MDPIEQTLVTEDWVCWDRVWDDCWDGDAIDFYEFVGSDMLSIGKLSSHCPRMVYIFGSKQKTKTAAVLELLEFFSVIQRYLGLQLVW